MKKCFKCGVEKSLDDFYVHKQMGDGHLNKCKDCNKKDVSLNRKDKIEFYTKYEVSRNKMDFRKEQRKQYLRNHRDKYPEKNKARQLVAYAISKGEIIPLKNCQDCGKVGGESRKNCLHAHHEDYSKPLDVVWLCASCHVKRHRKKK